VDKRRSVYCEWRFNNKCRIVPAGKVLRIVLMAAATVHWSDDGWQVVHDSASRDTGLGIHVADIPTSSLDPGHTVVFTFFWRQAQHWEGANFSVTVQEA
jgi:glucoamylase